jgi:hypothetical protein
VVFGHHSGCGFPSNLGASEQSKPIGTKNMPGIRNHLPVNFLEKTNSTKDSKIEGPPLKGLPPTKSKHRFFRYFSNE